MQRSHKGLKNQLVQNFARGRESIDIHPSSQPDRALSALNDGPKPSCNLSQLHHGRMPIACAYTTGYSITPLSQVSHRKLRRSQYTQERDQGNHSYTKVYQHLNAPQMHPNASYRHLSAIFLASPLGRTN
jgi:hypothetical protein